MPSTSVYVRTPLPPKTEGFPLSFGSILNIAPEVILRNCRWTVFVPWSGDLCVWHRKWTPCGACNILRFFPENNCASKKKKKATTTVPCGCNQNVQDSHEFWLFVKYSTCVVFRVIVSWLTFQFLFSPQMNLSESGLYTLPAWIVLATCVQIGFVGAFLFQLGRI